MLKAHENEEKGGRTLCGLPRRASSRYRDLEATFRFSGMCGCCARIENERRQRASIRYHASEMNPSRCVGSMTCPCEEQWKRFK
jgi:hypothetical protein